MRNRAVIVVVGCVAALALWPAAAGAATETLSLSLSPNPVVDGDQLTVTDTWDSDQYGDVWIQDLPPGSSMCPEDPDPATANQVGDDEVQGSGSDQHTTVPTSAGQHLMCGWLMPTGTTTGPPLATTQVSFTVSRQSGTLTLTAVSGQTITAHYSVNAPMQLFVDVMPASDGQCAASHSQAPANARDISGQYGFDYDNVSPLYGPGAITHSVAFFPAGSYRACGWLQHSVNGPPYDSGAVIAGPATTTFTISGGPPNGPTRVYRGRTSQHSPIRITAEGDQLTTVDWTVHFSCNRTVYLARGVPGERWNGSYSESFSFGPDSSTGASLTINKNGHFGISLTGNRRHTLTIDGRRVGKRLKGEFRETLTPGPQFGFTAPSGTRCRTGTVRFNIA